MADSGTADTLRNKRDEIARTIADYESRLKPKPGGPGAHRRCHCWRKPSPTGSFTYRGYQARGGKIVGVGRYKAAARIWGLLGLLV